MITETLVTLGAIGDLPALYWIAPVGALAALAMAFIFSRSVLTRSEGDSEMVRIAEAVRAGAMAYLRRQYKVVAVVFVALVVALALMAVFGLQQWFTVLGVPVAGTLSGLCGWFGMRMATLASARTTHAAKESLDDALTIAFRSGAVMGLVVVGFALLDVSMWFLVLNSLGESLGLTGGLPEFTTLMLSFGMGASTQALFARVGGGIYTKAADVGADLVGKVEAGIPEDDARNPATIADNVGDNVGDVAGMGADLYESYYGSILATMALGAAAAVSMGGLGATELAMRLAAAPVMLAGVGILCSIMGIFAVRAKEGASFATLLKTLHRGVYVASGLILIAALAFAFFNSDDAAVNWYGVFGSIASGLVAGLVIANATEYYTSYEHPPTQRISRQAITGPATVIISGIAEGMKSTWAPLLTVVIAIIAAFTFAGGTDNFLLGLYGVGIAAVGMLATLGITLATDAYGPIADNAGGNAEMTGQPPEVRERTDMLDSLGNTTAATGKGFAIGSAALTALALFAAYLQVVQTQLMTQGEDYARSFEYAEVDPGLREGPHVIWEGHGRMALVIPASEEGGEATYDAAIADPGRQSFDLDTLGLKPGAVIEVRRASDGSSAREAILDSKVLVVGAGETAARGEDDRLESDEGAHLLEFEVLRVSQSTIEDVLRFYNVTFMNPRALGGVFIGVLLAFLFCAMTMDAVGRAANSMMTECRRQFGKMREAFRAQGMNDEQIADPMSWPKTIEFEGTTYPDYARCVTISTAGAQKEMIVPALLAIIVPIAVGLVLDVPGVVGMLAGGLTSGFAVAIFMANAGGAWDNAKKLIESFGRITANELLDDPQARAQVPEQIRADIETRAHEMRASGRGEDYVYGKGSDDHKATVVGDTVGDPFKDTSGPSLNILIKLISIVSVVFAGLIVRYGPYVGDLLGLN